MSQTLLVIDVQQDLIDGSQTEKPVYEKEQLILNINNVIQKALTAEVPVVFVRDLDVAEGKGDGFQIHNKILVPTDSQVFDKSATNSFHGTGLLEYLTTQQVKHLVIMGCQTQHCIDSTVRTATISGFDVTLVGDGHSTSGNEILSPKQIIDHHNQTLHGHYNVEHFSIVRTSQEDLFKPTHDTYR